MGVAKMHLFQLLNTRSLKENSVLPLDKATTTILKFHNCLDVETFKIIVDFFEITSNFYINLINDERFFEEENEENLLKKFQDDTIHRYLNNILVNGFDNLELNVTKLIEFNFKLSQGDHDLLEKLNNFLTLDIGNSEPYYNFYIDNKTYIKLNRIFQSENIFNKTGLYQSISTASKLYAKLSFITKQTPSSNDLYYFYLGNKF
jgi:hypothetical protein